MLVFIQIRGVIMVFLYMAGVYNEDIMWLHILREKVYAFPGRERRGLKKMTCWRLVSKNFIYNLTMAE